MSGVPSENVVGYRVTHSLCWVWCCGDEQEYEIPCCYETLPIDTTACQCFTAVWVDNEDNTGTVTWDEADITNTEVTLMFSLDGITWNILNTPPTSIAASTETWTFPLTDTIQLVLVDGTQASDVDVSLGNFVPFGCSNMWDPFSLEYPCPCVGVCGDVGGTGSNPTPGDIIGYKVTWSLCWMWCCGDEMEYQLPCCEENEEGCCPDVDEWEFEIANLTNGSACGTGNCTDLDGTYTLIQAPTVCEWCIAEGTVDCGANTFNFALTFRIDQITGDLWAYTRFSLGAAQCPTDDAYTARWKLAAGDIVNPLCEGPHTLTLENVISDTVCEWPDEVTITAV